MIIAAIICLSGLLVWRDVLPLLARVVAVHELRYAPPPSGQVVEPMPEDLMDAASRLAGEWAQEDVKAAMRESYAELGDWTMVRARYHGVLS